MSPSDDASFTPNVAGLTLDDFPLGISVVDRQGRILQTNAAASRILGLSRTEHEARTIYSPEWKVQRSDGSQVLVAQLPAYRALHEQVRVEEPEMGVLRPDGEIVWLSITAAPLGTDRAVVTYADITEVHRSKAILGARSRLAEQARALTLDELLRATLDEAEALTGSCIGFYHFLEADQETLRLKGWSTRTEAEFCKAEGKNSHYPIAQAGVWADCVRERRPLIHNDYSTQPNRKGMPPGHATVIRELVIPVFRGGAVVAILGVGNKPSDYKEDDVEAVRLLADLAWDFVEQKRSESAIEGTSSLLTSVLDSLMAHVAVLDSSGNILAVNEPWRRFAHENGIVETVGSVEQVNYLDVMRCHDCDPTPGDIGSRQGIMEVLGGARDSFLAEYPCDSPTEQRWFRMHALPLKGSQIGALVTHEDITRERAALEALKQAHTQLSFAQKSATSGLWNWDITSGQILWSSELFELFGLDQAKEKASFDTWRKLIHPDDLKLAENRINEAVTSQQPLSSDYRILLPGGQVRWIQALGSVEYDQAGKPLRMAGICIDRTRRKMAEEALEAKDLQTKLMLRTAMDGVWLTDLGGTILDVNDAACSMLGYTREELLALRVTDIEAAESSSEIQARIERLLRSGSELFETRHRRKDGTSFPVEASITLLPNGAGIVAYSRDITDRLKAEEALVQSKEMLITAQRIAKLGSWEWDLTTDTVEWSDEMFKIFGVNPKDFDKAASSVLDVIHPDDRDAFIQTMESTHTEGTTKPLEYRVIHPDGSVHTVYGNGAIVSDQSGKPVKVIGTVQDISERKQAERAIQATQFILSEFVRHSPIYTFIKEVAPSECRVLFASDNYKDMVGYTGQEMVGKTMADLFPPEFATKITADDWQVASRKAVLKQDEELNGRSYTTFKFPIQGEDRVLLAGYTIDITDQKQAEAEKIQLLEQLRQAQKMESLGTLSGGVAHDMNNVLGAILGLASANIEIQPPGSPAYRAFETIVKAATRGGEMVRSLLAFARHTKAEDRVLDLNTLIRDEVRLLERTTLSKVAFNLELEDCLKPTRGDASAITHAFMNLCVNAVDAMTEGGILTLRTRNLDNEWIEARVEDNGIGMSKEVLDRATEPFFTTKGVGKGTGLGLSMVYSTIKAHQGQMEIISDPGVGTKVILRFPTCKNAEENRGLNSADGMAASKKVLRVLLVDDDDLIQSATGMILETMGHTVIPALTGEAAISLIEAGAEIDAVILDMNMPGMGGTGTLPRIRAMRPEVPVLLSTGRADQVALDLAKAHPLVTLIPKPFGIRELQQCLNGIGNSEI